MPKPYNPHDFLMKKAKKAGLRARSVYKLQELDKKFHLLQPGIRVLDLGAAPGSWLQYISQKIYPNGQALGLDLKEILPVADNILTQTCDITNMQQVKTILDKLNWQKVDLLLSDISPNTSGIYGIDHFRSLELNKAIFKLAKRHLNKQGKVVMKVFPGASFDQFIKDLKKYFRLVKITKVKASRDRSKEIYLVCS